MTFFLPCTRDQRIAIRKLSNQEKIMTAQNAAHVEEQTVNGVTVSTVMNIIGAIEENSDNAHFQFRLNNHWVDGGLNRSRVQEYFALGQEDDTRSEAFIVDADEPAVNAGGDSSPNPMEFVLHSLASCLTSTLVYHAAVQGIEIESVESWLEGDLDVRGMLGLSEESRKAYNAVRVRMRVKSAADAGTLEELARFSPVYDMISNSLPVEFKLEKA
jgi:uncharacterized OsmC-like protein